MSIWYLFNIYYPVGRTWKWKSNTHISKIPFSVSFRSSSLKLYHTILYNSVQRITLKELYCTGLTCIVLPCLALLACFFVPETQCFPLLGSLFLFRIRIKAPLLLQITKLNPLISMNTKSQLIGLLKEIPVPEKAKLDKGIILNVYSLCALNRGVQSCSWKVIMSLAQILRKHARGVFQKARLSYCDIYPELSGD